MARYIQISLAVVIFGAAIFGLVGLSNKFNVPGDISCPYGDVIAIVIIAGWGLAALLLLLRAFGLIE